PGPDRGVPPGRSPRHAPVQPRRGAGVRGLPRVRPEKILVVALALRPGLATVPRPSLSGGRRAAACERGRELVETSIFDILDSPRGPCEEARVRSHMAFVPCRGFRVSVWCESATVNLDAGQTVHKKHFK